MERSSGSWLDAKPLGGLKQKTRSKAGLMVRLVLHDSAAFAHLLPKFGKRKHCKKR